MKKSKQLISGAIFFCLAAFLIKPAGVVRATTTFPVDTAGIAAYVKLDNTNINLADFANACYSIDELGQSYVVGAMKIANLLGFNYPHIYVGADGWVVAYYLKTEEASRIMQWKNYTAGAINTTTLKDAIDSIVQKVGASYSSTIKYYDFAFPDANKMTLVADANDFFVAVPGTLFEASYNIVMKNSCGGGSATQYVRLKSDSNLVFEAGGGGNYSSWPPFASYGFYNPSVFTAGATHHISSASSNCPVTHATVLIYKN